MSTTPTAPKFEEGKVFCNLCAQYVIPQKFESTNHPGWCYMGCEMGHKRNYLCKIKEYTQHMAMVHDNNPGYTPGDEEAVKGNDEDDEIFKELDRIQKELFLIISKRKQRKLIK